jgi:hypothetical protein
MAEQSVTLILDTMKADVRSIWERHGFTPTTDEDRAALQRKNPHVEQCRCKFCQQRMAA